MTVQSHDLGHAHADDVGHEHGHEHEHEHPDGHNHSHPQRAPEPAFVDQGPLPAAPESLVLDIGGEIGALVLYAEEGCLGQEIDLTPAGQPRSHHMHTMIRRRRSADREFIAGVYPELTEGTYVVWGIDGLPLGQVEVAGGQVSQFRAGDCTSLQ